MKRFSIFTVCVFALLLGTAVLAQDPSTQPSPRQRGGPSREKRIKNMDVDKDGAISRDEWKGRSRAFDRIDKNGDGSLTREELVAAGTRQARPGQRKGRVKQMDT